MSVIHVEHVIAFLEDEQLTPYKIRNRNNNNWKIMINEPWGTKDSKFRCGIFQTIDKDTKKLNIYFNSFKAVSTLLDGDKYKGSFFKFVSLIKGIDSIREARIWFVKKYILRDDNLNTFFDNDIYENEYVIKDTASINFPSHYIKLNQKSKFHKKYIQYLEERCFPWKEFSIFIDPREKRVVFPVYENEELIFYIGRTINDSSIPWKKSYGEGIAPVWNLENVNGEVCSIFEAVFDAGMVSNGVAIVGAETMIHSASEKILNKGYGKIIVVMDNDIAGWRAKRNLADLLSNSHKNVWIYNYKGIEEKDFNQMKINNVPFDIDNRLYKWNMETNLALKMGKII